MVDLSIVQELKTGFDLFRVALGLIRDARDTLPDPGQREALSKSLEAAERASQIAEAQVAKALGYRLCQCTFPPQIMLVTARDQYGRESVKCSRCNYEDRPAPLQTTIQRDPDDWMT